MGLKQIQNIKYHKYYFSIAVDHFDQFQVTLPKFNMADQTIDKKVEEQEQDGHKEQEEQGGTSEGQEEESQLAKMLLSELECPICLESMVGRVRRPLLCRNGHACCSTCQRRLGSRCPTCRRPTSWSRCLALEKLGEHLVQIGLLQEEQEEQAGGWRVWEEEGEGGWVSWGGGREPYVEEVELVELGVANQFAVLEGADSGEGLEDEEDGHQGVAEELVTLNFFGPLEEEDDLGTLQAILDLVGSSSEEEEE